jgi:Ni,Fe-hydrogenase I cytochrome b subunit
VSVAISRADEIELWTGRLLALAGALIIVEFVNGLFGETFRNVSFWWWALSSMPFGIGFVLVPVVLLRSYQYVSDRTPRSAVVGVALVAALPVGTIVLVAWALLATTSAPVPEVTVLPVRIDTVFFALLLVFAGGITTFGLSLLRDEQTRLLGGSLLVFGGTWTLPLLAVTLLGVYPPWLNDIVVVAVATTMVAIGYCFPPVAPES